nr:bifunctional diaminohydroxyphosphoribosylaminopyrimidine deaminase/5-amino-6-(5-phosphoribosylamino)uracil reductase RibD [Lachnospiraceae bacterium]
MDEKYMRLAIELAKKGEGRVNPNPLVGAVIVKDDKVIGQGYHMKYGDLHAERNAIKNAIENGATFDTLKGAEMYVTLEPCSHYGHQPPCALAIIEKGIKKVYVGSSDPNPLVAGKGIAMLREAGVDVVENVLKEECDEINPVFFHFITDKTPYVVMKYATTLDGKIACYNGKSRFVTGEAARKHVQILRNRYMGIM